MLINIILIKVMGSVLDVVLTVNNVYNRCVIDVLQGIIWKMDYVRQLVHLKKSPF